MLYRTATNILIPPTPNPPVSSYDVLPAAYPVLKFWGSLELPASLEAGYPEILCFIIARNFWKFSF